LSDIEIIWLVVFFIINFCCLACVIGLGILAAASAVQIVNGDSGDNDDSEELKSDGSY
jgi:hypothetical protein